MKRCSCGGAYANFNVRGADGWVKLPACQRCFTMKDGRDVNEEAVNLMDGRKEEL